MQSALCFPHRSEAQMQKKQQQGSYNAHLVFKVSVPHGHICTELNLLQNVQ